MQLKNALENNSDFHRTLFANSPIAMALCRMDGELVEVNQAYADLLGRSMEEALQVNFWAAIADSCAESENHQQSNLQRDGHYGPYETHYACKNGKRIPVRLTGRIVQIADDAFICSWVEVVSHRENEPSGATPGLSEAKFHAIFASAVDGIVTVGDTGLIDSFNPGAEQMFGYKAAEVIGKNINILMPEPYHTAHDSYIQNYLSTNHAKIIGKGREIKGKRKDGSVFDIYLAVSDVSVGGERLFTGIVTDITDLKLTQHALQQSEERFRRSQRFANIGTWDWNIQTGELYWSDRIASLFGYQEGELETTYENFLNAIHADDRQFVIDAVNDCIEHGAEYDVEHRCVWPNGEVRWMLERGDVVRDEHGNPLRMLGVVQDITARKQTETDLHTTKEEAERANQAKSEFLSSMSHELRTPLNAVLGFAQLLEYDAQLNPQQKESIGEIQRAGSHLLELISEVLDLAKIESGRLDLSLEPVSLPRIIEECCALTQSIAAYRDITLHCCGYADGDKSESPAKTMDDIYVYADNIRLKQVLLNLLSNAVKYNRSNGKITVQCTDTSNGMLRIMIKDTGHGMSAEKLAQLFQPFNRLGAESGNIEGTGIGLVITKRLVHMMSGEIGVESTPGYGSTFWVELPRSEKNFSSHIPVYTSEFSPPMPSPQNRPLRSRIDSHGSILVLEDNRINQTILVNQLKVLGYSADVASNGKQGFEYWKTGRYTAILTDINMPDVNGFEFTTLIRKAEQSTGGHIPIIAITANALKGDEAQCLLTGMDDYLSKPVDLNKLREVLRKWIEFASPDTGPHETQHHADVSDSPVVDIGILRRVVGDHGAIQTEVLHSFANQAALILEDINNAYARHCAADILWASHKLKSSAHAIGATDLAQSCAALENAAKQNHWEDITLISSRMNELFISVSDFIHHFKPTAAVTLGKNSMEMDNSTGFSSVKLLVVDDDEFMLQQITQVSKQMGIVSPQTATGGKRALQLLDGHAGVHNGVYFNLILCDLNMPGMDGIEFLRHLAERNYRGGIVLISGEDARVLKSAEKLAKAHNLQILGTLCKPVTARHLHPLIAKLAEPDTNTNFEELLVSEQELAIGIGQGQVMVYYQPLIEIGSGEVVAMEALARWRHPQRGILGPNAFIPVAENHQLIDVLTVEVFSQAVQQAKAWKDTGLDLKTAINLSMDSLKRLELPELFITHINQSGLDYKRIGFEVTESRLMNDITTSLEILTRLKLKGIELSIDDFGTGYSTMEQLQRIPFSELKIDRQFVSGAVHDSSNRAILESSVELAKKLGMKVVAEGVETEDELRLVTRLGCDYIQGYYVSHPLPGSEVLTWINNWKQSNQFQRLSHKTGT